MIKEVDITELQVGQFVVEIVKQQGEYSLNHSGYIKSNLVIKKLIAKGVKSLLIDASKSKVTPKKVQEVENHTAPLIMEVHQAKAIFNASKKIQQFVML